MDAATAATSNQSSSSPSSPAAPPVMQSKSKLRYPLRSAKKTMEVKDASASLSTKRGKSFSTVTKSVSAFDLSGKEKSFKPPRRLSVPINSMARELPSSTGSITPISENKIKNSKIQQKTETPVSGMSKLTGRRRFSMLSSVSYWLSQIKLSETASKHSISLGFFRLALESECEPLQRVRNELKAYAIRHNIVVEVGEPAKELLQSYNILEDVERLQLSKSCPRTPKEAEQPSKVDKNSSFSAARPGSLKPRSLNSETPKMAAATKKDNVRKFLPAVKTRGSYTKAPINSGAPNDSSGIAKKKPNKRNKKSNKGPERAAKSASKSTSEKDSADVRPQVGEEIPNENKENLDNQPVEEVEPIEFQAS